jgi:hypothetical protein
LPSTAISALADTRARSGHGGGQQQDERQQTRRGERRHRRRREQVADLVAGKLREP